MEPRGKGLDSAECLLITLQDPQEDPGGWGGRVVRVFIPGSFPMGSPRMTVFPDEDPVSYLVALSQSSLSDLVTISASCPPRPSGAEGVAYCH